MGQFVTGDQLNFLFETLLLYEDPFANAPIRYFDQPGWFHSHCTPLPIALHPSTRDLPHSFHTKNP
jgi:hypothetical protein